MKVLHGLIALLMAFSFAGSSSEETIPGVKYFEENTEGHLSVTCANDSKGVVSFEETNICVFSKDNNKNRCDTEDNWTIEDAAEYICANN